MRNWTGKVSAVAAAAVLGCSACTGGGGGHDGSGESAGAGIPLPDLVEIRLMGEASRTAHALVASEGGRLLGSAEAGEDTLLFFTRESDCGFMAVRDHGSAEAELRVVSSLPEDEQAGSARVPGGPYHEVTAPGDSGSTWASLSCARDAMVVEYTTDTSTGEVGQFRGDVDALVRLPGSRTTVFVVASEDRRDHILSSMKRQR